MSHAGAVTISEDADTSGGDQVHLIAAADLESTVRAIFTAAGCADDEAGLIARELLGANLAGHDSHGVVRVPLYVAWKLPLYLGLARHGAPKQWLRTSREQAADSKAD